MNYELLINILKERNAKSKNGLTFDDYYEIMNINEVKDFLDKKFLKENKISKNIFNGKNYYLCELLNIYFSENNIEIEEDIDIDYDNDNNYVDILNVLLKEISQYKVLTREEEYNIFSEYKRTNDENIKKKIINHNLRLVVSVARKYAFGSRERLLEAIQDGSEGLLMAADKFDITKGNKFSTYATWWIRQAISRNNYNNGRNVRIPIHTVEKVLKMKRIKSDYYIKNGIEPTDEYLANKMQVSVKNIKRYKSIDTDTISIDAPVGEEEHGEESLFKEFIADHSLDANVEELIVRKKMIEDVKEMLDSLNEKERNILMLRFGIGANEIHTLEEVGKEFNVTRERIRQIECKALHKLKRRYKNKDIKDYLY